MYNGNGPVTQPVKLTEPSGFTFVRGGGEGGGGGGGGEEAGGSHVKATGPDRTRISF